MKTSITILSDNQPGQGFESEHGLSWLVETSGNGSVLLDAGASDLFLRNAQKMDIDLSSVEEIALSHGHWDHGNGLTFLENKRVTCHPEVFRKRFSRDGTRSVGLSFTEEQMSGILTFRKTATPLFLNDRVVFLGEIPRKYEFENSPTYFTLDSGNPDLLPDDSALAIIHNDELIVLTGCAHSGVCNIVDYAKQVTGIAKINTVMGGFHLKHINHQTEETISCLKSMGVSHVMPSHCTSFEVVNEFQKHWTESAITTGRVITFI